MTNIEALYPVDPDGGEIEIDGAFVELNWCNGNAYPFLGSSKIPLLIGTPAITHTRLIQQALGLKDNDWDAIYDFRDKCNIQGRVWLFRDGDLMIYTQWEDFTTTDKYSDSIYYEICDKLHVNPKEAFFIQSKEVTPIPMNVANDYNLSPVQRKLLGSDMPEAKYRHYRYVDENNNNNNNNNNKMKLNEKQLRKVIRESVVRILSERHHMNHDKTPQQSRRAWADYKLKNARASAIKNGNWDYDEDEENWNHDFDIYDDEFDNQTQAVIPGGNYSMHFDIDKDYDPIKNYNDSYSIGRKYHAARKRPSVDTHTLEKTANSVSDKVKDRQIIDLYDEIGNQSQYPKYDGRLEPYYPTDKENDIDAAWEEHGENYINEGRLNRIIRKSIRNILK